METTIPIQSIKVGKRFRKDYGDVAALAASINEVGLLQAIAVTSKNRLICGDRRLRAVKSLKWKTIDCRVLDIDNPNLAEHAENELRKQLTLSEKAALAQAIQEERGTIGRGGDRKSAATKSKRHPGALISTNNQPPTRQQIAADAGFTGHQEMERVITVVQQGIPELVKAMDANLIKPSRAAVVAKLPENEQIQLLKDSRTEDGQYDFKKPSAVKVKPPSMAQVLIERNKTVVARVWGIEEQFDSVEEWFNSSAWQRKENKSRIGEFVDSVEHVAKAYANLLKSCRAYCRKHGI